MKRLVFSVATAAVLWFVMFSPLTAHLCNFWWAMSASGLTLTVLAFVFGGNPFAERRPSVQGSGAWREAACEVGLGVAIAVALWGVFWVGDKVSQLLFSFARPQVELIYGMKAGSQPWLIGLLLLLVIGPAEELFWRGYVQRTLARSKGPWMAFVLTVAVYTAVHLPSLNPMLILAAATCGVAWGGLYALLPRHLPAIVLSHALWDAAAFVWFPF